MRPQQSRDRSRSARLQLLRLPLFDLVKNDVRCDVLLKLFHLGVDLCFDAHALGDGHERNQLRNLVLCKKGLSVSQVPRASHLQRPSGSG